MGGSKDTDGWVASYCDHQTLFGVLHQLNHYALQLGLNQDLSGPSNWTAVLARGLLHRSDLWPQDTPHCEEVDDTEERWINPPNMMAAQDGPIQQPGYGTGSPWIYPQSDEEGEIWDVPEHPPCYYLQYHGGPLPLPDADQEANAVAEPNCNNKIAQPPCWPPAEMLPQKKRRKRRTVVKSKPNASGKKLFVKNINFDSTQKELWDFFLTFGPVQWCKLLRDQRNRSRGIGFVTFESSETATQVLCATKDELWFAGRILLLEPAMHHKFRYHSSSEEGELVGRSDGNNMNETDDINAVAAFRDREPVTADCNEIVNSLMEQSTDHASADNGLSIDDLDDLTLSHIIYYISIKERIKIERVCKRWRYLSIKSWQRLHSLDFHNLCRRFGGLSDRLLQRLLARSGKIMLKSLNVSNASRHLTDRTMGNITKSCPNLIKLDISGSAVTNKGLEILAKKCTELEDVGLRNCQSVGEKGLWWLFHKCQKLKSVNLLNNRRLIGSCFHMLGDEIQMLNLSCCSQLRDSGLKELTQKCHRLEELYLHGCTAVTNDGISMLTQNSQSLKRLHLNGYYPDVTSVGLQSLGRLRLLEELYIQDNLAVNNETLMVLGQLCHQLRILNISCCNSDINSEGLASLAQCPHLEHLTISYLYQIEDAGMISVAQNGELRTLVAISCSGLSDPSLQALASHCKHLSDINVSGCRKITKSGIQMLVDCKQQRDKPLRIVVGGTSAEPSSVTAHEGVEVVWDDCSVRFLERDSGLFLSIGSDESDYEADNYAYGMDDGAAGLNPIEAEDFLDNDDPLLEERFFPS